MAPASNSGRGENVTIIRHVFSTKGHRHTHKHTHTLSTLCLCIARWQIISARVFPYSWPGSRLPGLVLAGRVLGSLFLVALTAARKAHVGRLHSPLVTHWQIGRQRHWPPLAVRRGSREGEGGTERNGLLDTKQRGGGKRLVIVGDRGSIHWSYWGVVARRE